MPTGPNASDYPYTGNEYPDRTGSTLVTEASRLALDPPVDSISNELGIPFDPYESDPNYTLDFGFDTEVETAINPVDLPIMSDFKITLIRITKQSGSTTFRYIGDSRQKPLTLASGSFSITVFEADEGPDTGYGRDRSPESVEDPDYAARALGPDHEVRLSDPRWNLDTEAVEKARQQL